MTYRSRMGNTSSPSLRLSTASSCGIHWMNIHVEIALKFDQQQSVRDQSNPKRLTAYSRGFCVGHEHFSISFFLPYASHRPPLENTEWKWTQGRSARRRIGDRGELCC